MRSIKFHRLLATLVLLLATVLGVWAFYIEPSSISVRVHRLAIPNWSMELSGIRVAILSDLHVGSPYNGIAKLNHIVELTNDAKPDLVLIPGDLVIQEVIGGSFVSPEDSAAVLAKLSAPLGVWATLGNHDWWLDGARVRRALEAHDIPVVDNEAIRITQRAAAFWLVGIGDFLEGMPNPSAAMREVTDDAPVLLITHNPDVFPHITARFNLLIAGHTHGGQVFLPFVGRPIIPSIYKQRYAIGHIVENGRHLFVSSGIGTSILPVRFRVPPEITILELSSES